MNRFVITVFSLLAFLLFCSKSCETQENENEKREDELFHARMDSIEHSLSDDVLSEQTLRAFEIKAEEKLADFADYLGILSDRTMDETFIEHAQEMILDLFISDTVHVLLNGKGLPKEKDLPLKEFLAKSSEPASGSCPFRFDSVILSEQLHRVNDLIYQGSISFLVRSEESGKDVPLKNNFNRKKVSIIAVKVQERIGRDTLQIWKIFLGGIN
jgi:hypothetical protein